MKLLKFIAASGLLLFATPTFAQSTATPVLPGLLVTSGCPSGYTACYVPYSNSNPLPVSATITPSGTQDTNLKQINGNTVSTGTGASGTGTQRVVTSTDSTIGVEGQDGSTQASLTNPFPVVPGTGVTFSVSAASLPLPTGASTAALQSNVQAAATASTPATVNFVEPVDVTGAQPNFATAVPVIMSDPYPSAATAVSCSTGNVAASVATCTMPASTAKFTYITGFDITGSGATLGSAVTCTLTNTGSSTHSYTFVVTAGALLADSSLIKSFSTPLKATAVNTAPVLSCPSLGTGNTNMTINMDGYTL